MTYQQVVGLRLTQKYVGSCKHMDDWHELGIFRVIDSKITPRVYDKDDYPDPSDVDPIFIKGYLKLDNNIQVVEGKCECCDEEERFCFEIQEVKKAIVDSFSSWGCSCEYDCCGCISERCSIIEEKSRPEDLYFELRISRTANY